MGENQIGNSSKVSLFDFSAGILNIRPWKTPFGDDAYIVADVDKIWAKSRELLECRLIRDLVTVKVAVNQKGDKKRLAPSLYDAFDREKLTASLKACGEKNFSKSPEVTEEDRRQRSIGWAHQVHYIPPSGGNNGFIR